MIKKHIKRLIRRALGWYVEPVYQENRLLRQLLNQEHSRLNVTEEAVAEYQKQINNLELQSKRIDEYTKKQKVIIAELEQSKYELDKRLKEQLNRIQDIEKREQWTRDRFEEHLSRIGDIETREEWTRSRFAQHQELLDRIMQKTEYEDALITASMHRSDLSSATFLSADQPLVSCLCSQEQLESNRFQQVCKELCVDLCSPVENSPITGNIPFGIRHRKAWEWAYIALALRERNLLSNGKTGVGFAVGQEPLCAYFASQGCEITATDLFDERTSAWIQSSENSNGNLALLNKLGICDSQKFCELVSLQNVDLNHIPSDMQGYDFCWSSCAIEHIGSLEKSKAAICNSLNVLRPGGVAVHTTEYNISSNSRTIEDGNSIIFRKCDIEDIVKWAQEQGHKIDVLYTRNSNQEGNVFVDVPPYFQINPKFHLNLLIDGFASTSIGLIITKRGE